VYTLILIVHIIVCVFLIFIVLIQTSKGAELGAAFGGGSSQTLFGARGAATFLSKLTTVAAIVFMLTSLTLAVFSVRQGSIVLKSTKKPPAERPFQGETGPLQEKTAPEGQKTTPPQPAEPKK
jgi:preprotein translocase subunit SecG